MQDSFLLTESIRTIEIFYYSSPNHIFINTALIELLSNSHIGQNIKIEKTQINQPNHHSFGQAPFLTINYTYIVKKQQLWDFLTLVLSVDPSRKYEFLSVANLTQQLSEISNLFSEFDQNPYFMLISPWKKYKRHKSLQNKKHWYLQNSLYFSNLDDSLNKEYFLYKINSLGNLIRDYSKEHATRQQYLRFYKVLVYALMKHLRVTQNTLYRTGLEVEILKRIEEQVHKLLNEKNGQEVSENSFERPLTRNIPFTNVHLKYLKQIDQGNNKPQEGNPDYHSEKEKLYQSIFKPVFSTVLFGLAMWAFR